ncbi:hypothetical protein [Pseudoalteromonas luteoviolacea]|uniref:Uncharacterized protein n=1 Tax=Pseudoalteromonas luteoviolacea S4060-1 TaxID=1365257 RepID=A0A162CKI8_9GAMM|nr:hypothetical protein [Pseudoalteromonas luteoviolacea]KZN69444.1 hypothetical protein N478_12485 [Pseudoalteromonas luteoviolacea S4060-1]
MNLIIEGINCFSSAFNKTSSFENFKRFEASYVLNALTLDRKEAIFAWLKLGLNENDTLQCSVTIGAMEPILFSQKVESIFDQRIEELEDAIAEKESDEKVVLKIIVRKSHKDEGNYLKLNIYSLEDFSDYLVKRNLKELASFLPNEFASEKPVNFNILHEVVPFRTNRFIFSQGYPVIDSDLQLDSESFDRMKLIEKRDKCGHFANASTMSYLPEDFHLLGNCQYKEIERVLKCLESFYLLVFLCDFSSVSSRLNVKMKGYKLLSQEFDIDRLKSAKTDELYLIYKWVYNEGNFSDKVGLARNLMSIHLKNDDLLELESGTVHSLESGYDIYLKENVKQYIEIKNKLSEFIQSSSDKANGVTKNMFTSMKNSLWGFVSFFLSVVFFRVITKGTVQGIVSDDILLIAYGIIGMSCILLWVAIQETNTDIVRFQKSYKSLKSRYKDLLDENDLNKILQNDKIHNEDVLHIKQKKTLYRNSWLMITFIMFIVVTGLWYLSSSNEDLDNNNSLPKATQSK